MDATAIVDVHLLRAKTQTSVGRVTVDDVFVARSVRLRRRMCFVCEILIVGSVPGAIASASVMSATVLT